MADSASAEEIDGATALQLDKGDWKELGCAGLKAAKVMGALAKLEAGPLRGKVVSAIDVPPLARVARAPAVNGSSAMVLEDISENT